VADEQHGTDDARLAAIARHALHDEELIAALAAGDLEDAADVERARSIVERCATCREIHRDLTDIRAAIRASGKAELAAMLHAPGDFRLTVEDAARLRPGSPVARAAGRLGLRARLGLGIAAFGRPVGAALATFGVVGLFIGSLTVGGTSITPMSGSGAGATSAAGIDQIGPAPEPSDNRANYGPLSTQERGKTETSAPGGGKTPESGSILLLGGSLVLLVLGIGLILGASRTLAPISGHRGN
jgi:hypothetical protein